MLQKEQFIDKEKYVKNLKRIIYETILTSLGCGFSVATITIFWNSIGMDQTAIGFVQMAFTIVICLLDIPMGYIADRFNRKALNIIGDIGVSFIFILYAFSHNIYMALLSECLLGLFMAMTNGVDQSFIKSNCNKIDETGNFFKRVNVEVYIARYTSMFIVTVWLFALNGFVHGLLEGNLATALQESAKDEIQTSIMSIASTGARLLYIPLVYTINYLGNIKLQLALLGVCCLFLPMCLIAYIKLRELEK